MTDYSELKRLAEAFPDDLDYDSNTESFFNGPSGESLGGGSTGFYCVYGAPFEIDGEQYDGHTYVEICKADFAKFMVSARDGVLALIAENEALQKSYSEAWEKARALQSECDEFAKDAERYRWLRDEMNDVAITFGAHCWENLSGDFMDEAIDAAMSKESPNG